MPFDLTIALGLATSAAVALIAPLVFALAAKRWLGARAVVWLIGAGTFFVSQVVLRLPWQIAVSAYLKQSGASGEIMTAWLIVSALTAGLFEEVGRYLTYRFVMKDRTTSAGLMLGLGHGGLESMLLVGLSLSATLVVYLFLSNGLTLGLPEAQVAIVTTQLSSLTFLTSLAAGVERLSAMAVHAGLSLAVLQCFTRKSRWWLVGAVLFHALSNFCGVVAMRAWGVWPAEAVIGLLAVVALAWTMWTVKRTAT